MTIQYIGLKKINAGIKSVKVNGAKLSLLIHQLGVQGLLHMQQLDSKTGKPCMDARPIDQLLQALPKGMRKEGFKLWVEMYSPVRWSSDGLVHVQKEGAKKYTSINVEGADANPFWDATPENRVKPLSPEAIRAIIDRETAKWLSANDKGEILDKDGNVRFVMEGNVVEMKEYAKKLKAAVDPISVPEHVAKELPELKRVPAAIAAAGNTSKVNEKEFEEPVTTPATGTNG